MNISTNKYFHTFLLLTILFGIITCSEKQTRVSACMKVLKSRFNLDKVYIISTYLHAYILVVPTNIRRFTFFRR